MPRLFLFQLKNRKPIFTIMLILSCLISTIPQFFLPDLYDTISGQVPTLSSFYLLTLSSFTHSPETLINHFAGNLVVFLLFGSITEIIIGSSRFAMISILTFTATSFVNLWHSTNGIAGHGASGIGWGYQVFFLFLLIILFEVKGKSIFKDPFLILLCLLMIFFVIGIPLLEVFVLGNTFFENFGQVLHLLSMLVVVPLILLWRKDIESNVLHLLECKALKPATHFKSISALLLVLLLLINVYGTFRAITITARYSNQIIVHINPPLGTAITQLPERISIIFKASPLKSSEQLITTSINYETKKPPSINTNWINDRTMEVIFSRRFQEKESLRLEYLIKVALEDNIVIDQLIRLDYK